MQQVCSWHMGSWQCNACLTAVETGPIIIVVGGDMAGIALQGLHGVLAPELCVRA